MKRKRKMSVNQLQERIETLRIYRIQESQGDNHPLYIQDLTDSIAGCERELSFYKANPDGVQMVK